MILALNYKQDAPDATCSGQSDDRFYWKMLQIETPPSIARTYTANQIVRVPEGLTNTKFAGMHQIADGCRTVQRTRSCDQRMLPYALVNQFQEMWKSSNRREGPRAITQSSIILITKAVYLVSISFKSSCNIVVTGSHAVAQLAKGHSERSLKSQACS